MHKRSELNVELDLTFIWFRRLGANNLKRALSNYFSLADLDAALSVLNSEPNSLFACLGVVLSE
jgi:hypothetical protein